MKKLLISCQILLTDHLLSLNGFAGPLGAMLNESVINSLRGQRAMGNCPERCNLAVFEDEQRNPAMNVLVTLKFPVRDSELDNFLTVLKEALIDTRAYDGCQSVSTYVERGTGFVFLVEHWDSAEHQQDYMSWRVETGLIEALDPYLEGETMSRRMIQQQTLIVSVAFESAE